MSPKTNPFECDPERQLQIVRDTVDKFEFIRNPCPEALDLLYKIYGIKKYVKLVKDISKKMSLIAVKKDGMLLEFIKDRSQKIQITAFEQNPYCLIFISVCLIPKYVLFKHIDHKFKFQETHKKFLDLIKQ